MAAAWSLSLLSSADTVYGVSTPGQLIRESRLRNGLSQRRLAHRAGTSQSAIARIEREKEEVTWLRLRSIMLAMEEEPVLSSRPLSSRHDASETTQLQAMTPAARLESGLNINNAASELSIAGRATRERG
jgi:transcriptional regulator with XRE-family HTH domain